MNVNFRAPRRVGFGKLPNARERRLQGGSASLGRTNLPLDFGKLPNAAAGGARPRGSFAERAHALF